MDGYPDSEEEFELAHEDEFDLLREQENDLFDFNPVRTTSKCFEEVPAVNNDQNKSTCLPGNVPTQNKTVDDTITIDKTTEDILIEPSENIKKRTIEELFGEIDDILNEEIIDGKIIKKKKVDNSDDHELIAHILELRRLAKSHSNPMYLKSGECTTPNFNKDNITHIVPKHSFVVVTKNDGQRLYIRCHSEDYEKQEIKRITKGGGFSGVMGQAFKEIWNEAQEIINKKLNKDNVMDVEEISNISVLKESTEKTTDLWVDLYKPKKYIQLLSDESTNRTLLRWLKSWDKIVFNRKLKQNVVNQTEQTNNKFQKEFVFNLDENGCPEQKVVLLCGPPGLGKTTLAHMVAKHAGYNVVEVNASDDRSTEKFKNILDTATQMRSVIDMENRPNCLIFDEIDGAPASSVEFLIKYINGTVTSKKKKGESKKKNILKRPIICICNDVYVPALRSLRQIAFVVNFPPTASARLAERLKDIAKHQNMKTDFGALSVLCEKSGNDIRSCLSVLHFFKSLNKPITLTQVYKTNIGQKDIQKGLFTVWQNIFQIQKPRFVGVDESDKKSNKSSRNDLSLNSRMRQVLQIVQSFGDYERLTQGVFENYITMNIKDTTLTSTCEALDWFCFTDVLNRQIYSLQNYSLSSYLPYAFIIWHYVFATYMRPKLNYPSVGYEAKVKTTKTNAILTEIMKGMQPSVRAFTYSSSLLLDTLPILSQIITPLLRPVSLHLFTAEEKKLLLHVVSVMIDYNLNYVQEKSSEGTYAYNTDPNINDLVLFSNSVARRILSYPVKQLVSREIDVEKMRRCENFKFDTTNSTDKSKSDKPKEQKLPNHLQRLHVKSVKKKSDTMVTKDFFGRIITKPTTCSQIQKNLRSDIWYQYKEGYSNAVRKTIKISNLK